MQPSHIPIEKTFSALSDTTRMAIIERLSLGESALSDIAQPFAMSQTAVTKHVKILRDAGLVRISKRGRTRYCELLPHPMEQAEKWLVTYQAFWNTQVQKLATFLDEEMPSDNGK